MSARELLADSAADDLTSIRPLVVDAVIQRRAGDDPFSCAGHAERPPGAWRSSGELDGEGNRPAEGVADRRRSDDLVVHCLQLIFGGVGVKVDGDADVVETGVALAQAEEGVQVDVAGQLEAQVVDGDAGDRSVRGVADGKAIAEGAEKLLDGLGAVSVPPSARGSSDGIGANSRIEASEWKPPFHRTSAVHVVAAASGWSRMVVTSAQVVVGPSLNIQSG